MTIVFSSALCFLNLNGFVRSVFSKGAYFTLLATRRNRLPDFLLFKFNIFSEIVDLKQRQKEKPNVWNTRTNITLDIISDDTVSVLPPARLYNFLAFAVFVLFDKDKQKIFFPKFLKILRRKTSLLLLVESSKKDKNDFNAIKDRWQESTV